MTLAPFPQPNNVTSKLHVPPSDIQKSSLITFLTFHPKLQCPLLNQNGMSHDQNDSWSVRTKIYLITLFWTSSHVQRTNQSTIILQSAWTTKLFECMIPVATWSRILILIKRLQEVFVLIQIQTYLLGSRRIISSCGIIRGIRAIRRSNKSEQINQMGSKHQCFQVTKMTT